MRRIECTTRLGLAGFLLVGFFAALVCAQDDTAPPVRDDSAVLTALDHEDYRVRQEQTRAMLMDDSLTADDIDRMYQQAESVEQRHRLLRVARHHLIQRLIAERFGDQAGPGSMGLTHHVVEVNDPQTASPRKGVMVVMTLPGFPAYASLEPGDVIINFAGESIPDKMTPAQFQNLIKSHQSNEQIGLTVLRNGVAVDVPFRLSHNQALSTVYDTSEVTLAEPYQGLWEAERQRIESLVGGGEPAASE